MYFAVLGKNTEISLAELEYAQPRNIKNIRNNIITFDSDFPEHIKQLGGIIKWGRVVTKEEMLDLLSSKKIIGVNDENLGKRLKAECGIKRYKIVKLAHTDKEVKDKGMEIIQVSKEQFGIVEGYQPIYLYEVIDFEKPGRSMQMGMMPAKLSHIMLNIGLSHLPSLRSGARAGGEVVIYDPFIGSGTTGFLANHFGYDFIGSDIDIKYAEQNKPRRLGHKLANSKVSFDLFQQDIHNKFSDALLAPLIKEGRGQSPATAGDLLILTEGRLGPIITAKSTPKDVQAAQVQVLKLYESFLDRISELVTQHSGLVTICAIPYYMGHSNALEAKLQEKISSYRRSNATSLKLSSIPEIYARKDQLIGRKIMIVQ